MLLLRPIASMRGKAGNRSSFTRSHRGYTIESYFGRGCDVDKVNHTCANGEAMHSDWWRVLFQGRVIAIATEVATFWMVIKHHVVSHIAFVGS